MLAPREWLFLGLVVVGWALFVIALGKDMSWDFRNYHWYAPFAFLNGRMGFDIAVVASGDLLQSAARRSLLLAGDAHAVLVRAGRSGRGAGRAISCRSISSARSLLRLEERRLAAAALAALCMTGGLTLSLAGTTYYDNVMSVFVLSGLAILITKRQTLATGSLRKAAAVSAAIAGLITGSAVGLKLPEAPYALGFAAALAIIPGQRQAAQRPAGRRRRCRRARCRAVRRLLVRAHGRGDRQSAVSLFQPDLPFAAGAGRLLSRHALPAA